MLKQMDFKKFIIPGLIRNSGLSTRSSMTAYKFNIPPHLFLQEAKNRHVRQAFSYSLLIS